MDHSKGSSMREVYSLHQETRKILNKQSYFTPKETIKRRTTKNTKVSRKKKKIKIIVEINEIEKLEKINETKS